MAPQFIALAQSAVWTGGTSMTTGSLTVQAGDLLVCVASTGSNSTTLTSPPTNSGAGLTWTLAQSSVLSGYTSVYAWTAVADSARSLTVTIARAGGSGSWGLAVQQWRGGAAGASAKGSGSSGAPSLSLTTTRSNSAIAYVSGDWAPAAGTPTWRTIGTIGVSDVDTTAGSRYYVGHWVNAGATGAKTTGLSAPSAQKWAGIAVEIVSPTITVSPTGIASAEAFGSPTATLGYVAQPTGIPSAEALGSPTVTPATLTVSPTGIVSALVFGSPTVTSGTWQELIWTPAFIEAIESHSRTVGWRVELIDAGGRHVTNVPVTGGSVNFNGDTAEQWACSLTVPGAEWVPRRESDPLGPVSGLRCRIWWQIMVSGGMVEIPLSTYVLEDPRVSNDGSGPVTTVTGRDPLAIIRRTGYGSATVALGAMMVPAALSRILAIVAPRAPYRIDSTSTVTLPAVYEVGQRDVLEDMMAIASLAGLHVRTDREGVILVAPIPRPSALRADWQEGPDCAVISLSRDIATSQMVNSVTVTSTSTEVTPPISATVEDDDPASPTYVGGIWGRRSHTVRSDVVATQAGAASMARAELLGRRRPTEQVTVTVPARGDLSYRDLVALRSDGAGIGGLYRVKAWSMTITAKNAPPATMSVTMMTRTALG